MRKVIFIAFLTSLIAATVSSIFLFLTIKQVKKNDTPSFKTQLKNYVPKEPEKEIYNILLLGYGGAGHSGGGLSDANVVASINVTDKAVSLIAVPRDLWVQIPIRSDLKENHKINFAFAIGNDDKGYGLKQSEFKGRHGGGNLAKFVFGQTLGLNIDYYLAVDFTRFERAIDSLGGVVVDVPVSFTDNYFPVKGREELLCDFSPEKMVEIHQKHTGFELEKQFECRYEKLEFVKGETQMDGATALKYIRSRHSENYGSDFARGERQQAVLSAIKDKLVSLNAIDNIDDFYEEFRLLVVTDIDNNAILEVLPKIGKLESYTVKNINITDKNLVKAYTSPDGQSALIPNAGINNFGEIQKFIKENL